MNGMPIDSQARLAEVKAKQLAGELVDMAEVEAKWRLACRLIRSRILSVAERMRDLTPQQRLMLLQELRMALSGLAEGQA
jgi:phage terminase Nu1 subunit (DNA packaging protein)